VRDRPLFSTVSARRTSTRRYQDHPLPSRPGAGASNGGSR